jgi:hypothetical protein
MGATLRCSFGLAPSSLVVLPKNRVFTDEKPDANIGDHVPLVNILPFGECISEANPAVEAATVAAFGVPTPAPCIPATSTPWMPGAVNVLLGDMPSLSSSSVLMCMWGGIIEIVNPGEETVEIP